MPKPRIEPKAQNQDNKQPKSGKERPEKWFYSVFGIVRKKNQFFHQKKTVLLSGLDKFN